MQDDNHFRSVELAITNPNDLPAYVNASLISIWQAVQFILSFRPRERSTEYNELKLSDLKAMLFRFRASIPEMGQPWLQHVIVSMILLKRQEIDPLRVLEHKHMPRVEDMAHLAGRELTGLQNTPSVEDVWNMAEGESEDWATVALRHLEKE